MKNIYTIVLLFLTISVNSQTTIVDFTSAEGYAQGALDASDDWGGSLWFVYPTAGDEKITTTAPYAWAHWGTMFTMAVGDEMTFRLELKFTGDPVQANKKKARIGFNTGGVNKYTTELLYLTCLNDGTLHVRNPSHLNLTSGTSYLTDFQSDNLAIDVVIKIGIDAESSSYTARLSNLTDNFTATSGEFVGINQTIYDKAITTGISGIFQSQEFTGTQYFTVTKLIMTQGNTLSSDRFNKPNFNLSQNPVHNELGITGLATGSLVSIYSVTGAKASSHVFNGSSLNLSHLNTGVYFMETPGFAVKKIIKK